MPWKTGNDTLDAARLEAWNAIKSEKKESDTKAISRSAIELRRTHENYTPQHCWEAARFYHSASTTAKRGELQREVRHDQNR